MGGPVKPRIQGAGTHPSRRWRRNHRPGPCTWCAETVAARRGFYIDGQEIHEGCFLAYDARSRPCSTIHIRQYDTAGNRIQLAHPLPEDTPEWRQALTDAVTRIEEPCPAF